MTNINPIPQRVITISIIGVKNNARVFYSYVSPISGKIFSNSPTCEIDIDQPTYTLYVLDFASSMNGWTITGTVPNEDPRPLPFDIGPHGLSLMTDNPFDPMYRDHAYYIIYSNSVTGAGMRHDPQEGNVTPPIQSDDK